MNEVILYMIYGVVIIIGSIGVYELIKRLLHK